MHSDELRTAANEGDTETVAALLARGADVHCQDYHGYGFSGCVLVSLH